MKKPQNIISSFDKQVITQSKLSMAFYIILLLLGESLSYYGISFFLKNQLMNNFLILLYHLADSLFCIINVSHFDINKSKSRLIYFSLQNIFSSLDPLSLQTQLILMCRCFQLQDWRYYSDHYKIASSQYSLKSNIVEHFSQIPYYIYLMHSYLYFPLIFEYFKEFDQMTQSQCLSLCCHGQIVNFVLNSLLKKFYREIDQSIKQNYEIIQDMMQSICYGVISC